MTASSHTVFRITAPDGRAVVVKQVPARAAVTGRSLSRELFVYRLANWIPGVAAALPAALHLDESRQVLVLESLGGDSSWPVVEPAVSIGNRAVAECLGGLMAGWHRATTDTALWPAPASGILHLPDALPDAIRNRPQTTRRLMESIATDAELAGALRAGRERWRDRCLIHGDIRRENWIGAHTGRRGLCLRVIDWELSGSGDPAWDLGSVLAEFVLENIRDPGDHEAAWRSEDAPHIRAFFRAYRMHRGLLDPGNPAECEQVVLCAVARLVHIACEWADLQSDDDPGPVPAVIDNARLLLRSQPALVALLQVHRRR
jgi:aminoglycoside phosphotransferase (APT) family kinase protein